MKPLTINKQLSMIFMCLAVLIVGCIQVVQRSHPEDARIDTDDGFKRGLWVRAASMAEPGAIERIIALSRDMEITDLYAQVVVGGYAYYRSQYLPRSQYLAERSDVGYDPLNAIIRAAHKHGIRVHAWVNCLLAWSLRSAPDSSRHIFYAGTTHRVYPVTLSGRSP